MAGNLDGTHVCGVPLRANVVVLQDAIGAEVVDKRL
jgi:hypothetical protein